MFICSMIRDDQPMENKECSRSRRINNTHLLDNITHHQHFRLEKADPLNSQWIHFQLMIFYGRARFGCHSIEQRSFSFLVKIMINSVWRQKQRISMIDRMISSLPMFDCCKKKKNTCLIRRTDSRTPLSSIDSMISYHY